LAKPRTSNEGSVHSADGGKARTDKSIDPEAHRERGPQDDSVGKRAREGAGIGVDVDIFRAFVKAGTRVPHLSRPAEVRALRTSQLTRFLVFLTADAVAASKLCRTSRRSDSRLMLN
jgi:hypothetical protein